MAFEARFERRAVQLQLVDRQRCVAAQGISGAGRVLQFGLDFIGVALADPYAADRKRDVARRELAQVDPGRAHEGGDGVEPGVEKPQRILITIAIQAGVGHRRGARQRREVFGVMHPHRIGVDIVLPLAPQQGVELRLGLGMQEALEADEAGVG